MSEDLGSGEGHVGGHKWHPLAVPLHGGRYGDVLLTLPESTNLIQTGLTTRLTHPLKAPLHTITLG